MRSMHIMLFLVKTEIKDIIVSKFLININILSVELLYRLNAHL